MPRIFFDPDPDPTKRISKCLAEYMRKYDQAPTRIEVRTGDVPDGYCHPSGVTIRTSPYIRHGDVLIYLSN